MDIWRLLAAAFRRWYVLLPLLVMTNLAAVSVHSLVKPEYQTTAIISLVPSPAPVEPDSAAPQVENPYGSLEFTATVIEHVMNSSAVSEDLAKRGLSPDYKVASQPRTAVLGIEVTTSEPGQAIATGRELIDVARHKVADRQAAFNVPESHYVSIDVLDDADSVTASVDGQIRAMVAIMAAGGMLSFLGAVAIDDLLLLRRRRQGHDQQPPLPPSPPPAPTPEATTSPRYGLNGSDVPAPTPTPMFPHG